ncbi:hypothetical protein EDD15DRAFT_2203313 [Pisolithus albus]|nr:hypothetical protein EDD15DRAFT_2203313 [Pisolithus albus]
MWLLIGDLPPLPIISHIQYLPQFGAMPLAFSECCTYSVPLRITIPYCLVSRQAPAWSRAEPSHRACWGSGPGLVFPQALSPQKPGPSPRLQAEPGPKNTIRDCHPDFLVTAYSWPTFLYENELFDPNNPADGLFKGRLLVKAFKQIFTSPSSVLKMDDESFPRKRRRRDERRTRSHVASLLGMKSVSPRAVAYTAVQLRFALSSCGAWRVVDGEFNYEDFYNNIIDFFEDAETPDDKNYIRELLLWWNRKIFGRSKVLEYSTQRTDKLSVAMSLKRSAVYMSRVS